MSCVEVLDVSFFSTSETKAAMNLFRKDVMTKKEKEKEIQYEDPPDGGWGWMVVLHCFLVCPPYDPSSFKHANIYLHTVDQHNGS